MKKTIIPAAILAVAAGALLAPPAHAQTTLSYSAGDLVLGFEDPAAPADDYLVDLGQASYFITLSQTPGATNITTSDPAYGGSLGNLAADLSNTFGSTWHDNNAQGDNVQWGVIGATPKLSSDGSIPEDTIFLTQPENFPGAGSNDPTEGSLSTQKTWDSQVNSDFAGPGNGFVGATTSTNSNYAVVEPSSDSDSWTNEHASYNAFATGLDIEQSQNAALTDIGPTNSQLDLYELLPTSEGGTGSGTELGSFTLDSSGDLEFTSAAAVPEPSTYAAIGLGAAILLMLRRNRRTALRT
jgi:hypothetical protein